MKVISVNVGRPRLVLYNGAQFSTAIFKTPVEGGVMARRLNLDGDRQANLNVHGGEHKAVYAYPGEHYAAWAAELDRNDLKPGQFGENLTVEGLLEDSVCIGDRYRAGEALLEVSQPRVPCQNLAVRMKDDGFPKRFHKSGRTGFYLRVIEEGLIGAGDAISLVEPGVGGLTIAAIRGVMYGKPADRDAIEAAAGVAALSEEWRTHLLARIGG